MQRTQSIDASVDSLAVTDAKKRSKTISTEAFLDVHSNGPPTSYMETMMHLFKGNVGTGCFAMADAVKNCGLVLGPILTVIIAIICVHVQHILITCAEYVKESNQLEQRPDYAETIELSFTSSPIEKWRKWGPTMKRTCNIFICITQLGFCSVYYLFVGKHVKHVLDFYDINIELHLMIAIILVPVLLTSLIRQLKYIGECWNALQTRSVQINFKFVFVCSNFLDNRQLLHDHRNYLNDRLRFARFAVV